MSYMVVGAHDETLLAQKRGEPRIPLDVLGHAMNELDEPRGASPPEATSSGSQTSAQMVDSPSRLA